MFLCFGYDDTCGYYCEFDAFLEIVCVFVVSAHFFISAIAIRYSRYCFCYCSLLKLLSSILFSSALLFACRYLQAPIYSVVIIVITITPLRGDTL
jgi:hypothetical protein